MNGEAEERRVRSLYLKIWIQTIVLLTFFLFLLAGIVQVTEARRIEQEGLAWATQVNSMAVAALRIAMIQDHEQNNPEGVARALQEIQEAAPLASLYILRSNAVSWQFDLPPEVLPHQSLDREALMGRVVREIRWANNAPLVHYVTPLRATETCRACHKVPVGTVLGAVCIEIPLDRYVASRVSDQRRVLLVTLVSSFMVAGLLTFVTMRRLVLNPLNRIREGAQRIARGELAHRVDVRTGDELEVLAQQFNSMAERLQEMYTDLEGKVAERTAALRRQTAHLQALNDIITAATMSTGPQELLEEVLKHTLDALGLTQGAIWLQEMHLSARAPASRGMSVVQGLPAAVVPTAFFALPDTVAVSDWEKDREARPMWAPIMRHLGIRASIAVPILVRGKPVGGLIVTASEPREWTSDEVELVEAVGKQIGVTAERLQLLAELQAALCIKDELIQDVSHELRTPLTPLLGYAKLMNEEMLGPLSSEQRNALQVMLRNIERLRFMVDRLILLRTLNAAALEREPINLAQWLQDVVKSWCPRAGEAGLLLRLYVDEDPLMIQADRRLLKEVMDNLLHNAIKFSPDGGTITVRVSREYNEVVVAVADEGVGIPQDKLARVFDRFYQVSQGPDRQFEGLGIGLALCRRIAELHGGRIWAHSEGNGKGSTFFVAFPLAEEDKPSPRGRRACPTPPVQSPVFECCSPPSEDTTQA